MEEPLVTPSIPDDDYSTSAGPLVLDVVRRKKVYCSREPIYMMIRLVNVSERGVPTAPLKVSTSDIAGNLGIVMTREDGVRKYHPRYDESGRFSISAAAVLPVLRPGCCWFIVVELLSYYHHDAVLMSRPEKRIEIEEGRYKLEAFYRWDLHPEVVIRSGSVSLSVRNPSPGERWRRWRAGRRLHAVQERINKEDAVSGCISAYALDDAGSLTSDVVRKTIEKGLQSDPLGTIGALYVIEEQSPNPPLFLYDLITYREPQPGRESGNEYHRLLEELEKRWPDGFMGAVARQKCEFERIAGCDQGVCSAMPGGHGERMEFVRQEEK